MNADDLRRIAARHTTGAHPSGCPDTDPEVACDAAALAREVERQRAWADFASDLLDAHIWGFGPGDWQAADALAHALVGTDWPPPWKRDPNDAKHIIVDPTRWPYSGVDQS